MATDESLGDYGHDPNPGLEPARGVIGTQKIDPTTMSQNEREIFDHILRPDDSYQDGVYWADMGIGQRMSFVNKVNNAETVKELGQLGAMIKRDPLSPVGWYTRNAIIPGAGLLMEGYVLFSIGNVSSILSAAFPACWSDNTICNKTWVESLAYLEIIGIICGQILVGFIGDWVGRRWGLIQDSIIMFTGLLMLIAAWGVTQNGWVICYAWSLWFYGVGVGGEYPMTATAAMENAVGSGKISPRDDRLHRGRTVTSAFLMQGWGQFFNQAILILLLLIFNSGHGGPPYSQTTVQWTYRVSFVPPALGTLWLIYYRCYKMKAASKQLIVAKKKANVTGYDVESLYLTFKYFGFRVLATAGAWFANDVFFYGNKLFQGSFISALDGGNTPSSVMVNWLWNMVNIGVELVGYYLASFLIDHKLYGRKWMMIVGFLGDFICFTIPAFNYNYYALQAPHKFQVMYFLSSFFSQFGPNCVTFIVAAEVFPTPIRATAHGFSAAMGKMGALLAAVLYNYIGDQKKFIIVTWFGLAGALLTYFFLPDTTGLDLKEQERRWNYIRAGRESEYHGVAVHPKHLSVWERVRGVGKYYDPKLDYEQKVADLRSEWEEMRMRKAQEGSEFDYDDTEWSSDVSTYFERTVGSTKNEKVGGGDS